MKLSLLYHSPPPFARGRHGIFPPYSPLTSKNHFPYNKSVGNTFGRVSPEPPIGLFMKRGGSHGFFCTLSDFGFRTGTDFAFFIFLKPFPAPFVSEGFCRFVCTNDNHFGGIYETSFDPKPSVRSVLDSTAHRLCPFRCFGFYFEEFSVFHQYAVLFRQNDDL